MSHLLLFRRGLMAGVLMCAASAMPARGGVDDADRLAKRLLTTAEKLSDLQETKAKYGRRAEIAWTILQDQKMRNDVNARRRNMDSVIATFPQNRRWWVMEQWAFYEEKLALDRQVTALDQEMETLRLQEQEMYEEQLERARREGNPVKPFAREALLGEMQRLERESRQSVFELKGEIEAAAREKRTTPRRVLDEAVARLGSLKTPDSPDVERHFLPGFIKSAGGDGWLDRGFAPAAAANKEAAPPRKTAKR